MTVSAITAAAAVVAMMISAPSGLTPTQPSLGHVHQLELDRSDGHLLLATHAGLYEISLWSGKASLVGPVGAQRDMTSIASFGQTLYGSGRRSGATGPSVGLSTSTDRGQLWTFRAMFGHRQLRDLTLSQVHGQLRMLALDASNSALRSDDGGVHWSTIPGIRANAIETSGSQTVAATEDGVRISFDGGATWSAASGPRLRLLARGTPSQASLIGIDAQARVWTLVNGRWSPRGSTPSTAQALTSVLTGRALTLVVATNNGIQTSTDWGTTWTTVTTW
jgi:hypothetical protein